MLQETLTGWNKAMRKMDVRYPAHPTEPPRLIPGELRERFASVHTGAGAAPYRFAWPAGGESLACDDMDAVPARGLR